jgi:opine dehydrogenase
VILLNPKSLDESCVSILGAGSGGQAFAAYAKEKGYNVKIWNRSKQKIDAIHNNKGISASGLIEGHFPVDLATSSIKEAIQDSQLVMIVTPANAHKEVAQRIAPYLDKDQIVVLNPGRTGGALEVSNEVRNNNGPFKPKIVEAQSLLFVARSPKPASVNIAGIKRKLPVAAFPAFYNYEIIQLLQDLNQAFLEAETVLNTSFDNIGAIFHPGPLLLNVARCENPKITYRHYIDGITPTVASFLEKMDEERINVANAYGVTAISLKNWLNVVYGSEGVNLHETIQKTREYQDVLAPSTLDVRYIFEDVPTGLVPISSLGIEAGILTPHIDVIINLANCMLKTDYYQTGRTIESMGLADIPSYLLKEYVTLGDDFYIDIKIQEGVLED